MKKHVLLFGISLFLLSCGITPGNTRDIQGDYYALGAAVTNLTYALNAANRRGDIAPGMTDREMLERATSHDPTLLEPFQSYSVRVQIRHKRAVVLLCDPEGRKTIVEDANCSPRPDFIATPGSEPPCEFHLDVEAACARPQ